MSHYQRLDETGTVPKGSYPERFVCDLEEACTAEEQSASGTGQHWRELARIVQGARFAQLLLGKFNDAVIARFGADVRIDVDTDCRLVRDFSNYAIAPHTDSPRKLVSLLFYMPRHGRMDDLGTSIFVPIDPDFRCEGTTHHSFGRFKKAMTAPFRPNSLLGFFKTDRSFHGVERIERGSIERDSVLYNINVRKVVRRVAPQAGAAREA
jgi:hypothetical protein